VLEQTRQRQGGSCGGGQRRQPSLPRQQEQGGGGACVNKLLKRSRSRDHTAEAGAGGLTSCKVQHGGPLARRHSTLQGGSCHAPPRCSGQGRVGQGGLRAAEARRNPIPRSWVCGQRGEPRQTPACLPHDYQFVSIAASAETPRLARVSSKRAVAPKHSSQLCRPRGRPEQGAGLITSQARWRKAMGLLSPGALASQAGGTRRVGASACHCCARPVPGTRLQFGSSDAVLRSQRDACKLET
jgi:hypothetical protein